MPAGENEENIRCAKLALDRGEAGAMMVPSAYYFKHPPQQMSDSQAKIWLEKWKKT